MKTKTIILLAIASISMLAAEPPKESAQKEPPILTDAQRADVWRAYGTFQEARATVAELESAAAKIPQAREAKQSAQTEFQRLIDNTCGAGFTVVGDQASQLKCMAADSTAPRAGAKPPAAAPRGVPDPVGPPGTVAVTPNANPAEKKK